MENTVIKLQEITKTYNCKGKKSVDALKGISIDFEQTGMTFLLGKSGCGKTTLLNIIGGLDKPTSGDLLFYERSLNAFSQGELDSYRNTHIGFVFQEYNLLENYTVAQNIALALELQGKKVRSSIINDMLNKVGLSGYGDRHPNTLSGGEKQRLAIARALVKKPSVIIADEPTGALDSETSTQILTLLKDLSKDTLVVVVSHDREYASDYGDRIIELKDGKVISDSKPDTKNQSATQKELTLIKSRLPLMHCLKMALSSLKVKPIRLVATILITALAFSMFGLADTFATYNKEQAVYMSMINNNISYASFTKEIYSEDDEYWEKARLKDSDIKYIQDNNPDYNIKPIIEMQAYFGYNLPHFIELVYYSHYFYGAIEFSDDDLQDAGFDLIEGRLPSSDKINEIAVSKYVYEHFESVGYSSYMYLENESCEINSYRDLIGKEIFIDTGLTGVSAQFEIVGIIDTKLENKYTESKLEDSILASELSNIIKYSYHSLLFISTGLFDKIQKESVFSNYNNSRIKAYSLDESGSYTDEQHVILIGDLEEANNCEIIWQRKKDKLEQNEIVVSAGFLNSFSYDFAGTETNIWFQSYKSSCISEEFASYCNNNFSALTDANPKFKKHIVSKRHDPSSKKCTE